MSDKDVQGERSLTIANLTDREVEVRVVVGCDPAFPGSERTAVAPLNTLEQSLGLAEEVGIGPDSPAEVNLSSTTDGKVWAQEFMAIWREMLPEIDEDVMSAWFTGAIMVGWDHGRQRLEEEAAKKPTDPLPQTDHRFGERLRKWLPGSLSRLGELFR